MDRTGRDLVRPRAPERSEAVLRAVPASAPWRRWFLALGEAALACGSALGFAYWAVTVPNDPTSRIGQVSGLAELQVRLLLIALPLLAVVLVTAFHGSDAVFRRVMRAAGAVMAGLGTGFLAGGIVFSLSGTPWPLAGQGDDNGRLEDWAATILKTGHMPNIYPPLLPHLTAFFAEHLTGGEPAFALKWLLIAFVALTGPAAYLSWRMFLKPLPALAVGMLTALPVGLPYKPYSMITLIIVVPLLAKLLQLMRGAPRRPLRDSMLSGAAAGLGLGLTFLLYAGWHVWSAPGFALVVAAFFPWRAGKPAMLRSLTVLGSAGLAFGAVAGRYTLLLLSATGTKDRWCSPMVPVDPAFIAMSPYPYRASGTMGGWPPPGEFGGVGLFSVLLVLGIGVALTLGLHHSPVATTLACFLSAWFIRFWISSSMERDQAVQLYVRTYHQLLYTGLVLLAWAVILTGRWLNQRMQQLPLGEHYLARSAGRRRLPAVGVLLAAALFGGMAASATTDSYLPMDPAKYGWLSGQAWIAQQIRKPDGQCPKYARDGHCTEPRSYQTSYEPSAPDIGTLGTCDYAWHKDR